MQPAAEYGERLRVGSCVRMRRRESRRPGYQVLDLGHAYLGLLQMRSAPWTDKRDDATHMYVLLP